MKFQIQIEHHYSLELIKDKEKLVKLEAHRLLYDFVENLPVEQFNSLFNVEILEPTEEAIKLAFKRKEYTLLDLLRILKKDEKFKIHLHINL